MLEQLFDFCRLYPVARFFRGWTRIFTEGSVADESWWEVAYRKEEHNGHELLQRQNRLEERRAEMLSRTATNEEPLLEHSNGKHPGELPKELYDIDEQLLDVGRRYNDHRKEIIRLCSIAKDTCWVRGVIMSQRHQYSFIPGHDKPYYWVQRKKLCAASGGCCSRKCGCCERPLSWGSTSLLGSKNKEGGVYAHCTPECGCCIKRNGGYAPQRPLLQKPQRTAEEMV